MAKITNISNGPRGAYADGQLVMAEAGETIEADDFAPEWFAERAGSLSALKKADLVAIAEAEGVTVKTDDNRSDLIRKIEEKREEGQA